MYNAKSHSTIGTLYNVSPSKGSYNKSIDDNPISLDYWSTKYDRIDFQKNTNEIIYQFKDLRRSIPNDLRFIFNILKENERLLNLTNNWDNEGSEGYLESTWKATAFFLLEYSTQIYNEFNFQVDSPKIYPSANGSIDIDWETDTYGIIINIEKNGNKATYYGDNKSTQMTEGVFNPLNFNINLLPKAIHL